MSETANYHLYLTDDSSEKFQEWRENMNGPDNSNMVKIDTALSEKAEHSNVIETKLDHEQWENQGVIMTQTLSVEGLTAEQNGVIGISHTISSEALEAVRMAGLYVIGQGEGTLTIALDGDLPYCDIPVTIILLD